MDTLEFWKTKAVYLAQENTKLRDQLLEAHIQAGAITLTNDEQETNA